MPPTYPNIEPGDVISSDLMKFILSKLGEIDDRVVTLETGGTGSGPVIVTGFDPPAQQAAGQQLEVQGTGFAFPPELNSVTIDDTPIAAADFRPGSNTARLRFIVPTTLSIPAGGRNVTVRVANTTGDYAALYKIMPAIVAPGNPPDLTGVAPVTGPFILVNEDITITGQNFAAVPAENIIRFRLSLTGVPEVVYPLAGSTIPIDAALSNTTQIVATVPDITEIAAGESRNVTLEVGVGAHLPAQTVVQIARPL